MIQAGKCPGEYVLQSRDQLRPINSPHIYLTVKSCMCCLIIIIVIIYCPPRRSVRVRTPSRGSDRAKSKGDVSFCIFRIARNAEP